MNHRSRTRIASTSSLLTPRRPSRRSIAPWSGIVCFVLLAVVSLTLLTWKVKNRMPVAMFENALLSSTRPFQQVATWATQGLSKVWDNYVYLVNVQRDNKQLREEIKWLQQENHRYLEAYLQYQRLQRLLNFREQTSLNVVAAEVVGRNSNSWTEIIYINRGTRDKVAQGYPVVTYDGLVGQVIHAAPALIPGHVADRFSERSRCYRATHASKRCCRRAWTQPCRAEISPRRGGFASRRPTDLLRNGRGVSQRADHRRSEGHQPKWATDTASGDPTEC